MLAQIIFLLITARQINFSHQCELCNQEGSSLVNLPRPFPCGAGGGVAGIPSSPGPGIIHARPIAAEVNFGSIGPASVNLGAPAVNLKSSTQYNFGNALEDAGFVSVGLGTAPIGLGSGPINLGPAVPNFAPISRPLSSLPITSGSVVDVSRPSPSSISNISPIRLPEIGTPGAGILIPARPSPQSFRPCIRHALVPVPVQVIEECIRHIPVIRKTIRPRVETITRHVPVYDRTVTQQHEKIIRHVPVARKFIRNIVETRVRHVPVIKSRSRTVIEPYTLHVPITERYTRPVEDSITRTVPYTVTRVRPVVVQRTRLVPVIERRCRPVVETTIQHIPVRRNYVRNVVEQRAQPEGPCRPCVPFYGRPARSADQDLSESSSQENNNSESQYPDAKSSNPTASELEGPSDDANNQPANSNDGEDSSSLQYRNIEQEDGSSSNSNFEYSPKGHWC
uniref:Uncharacterized protein n=1 Tax=Lygus hesperus TaxID=30085 RepID=A0A146KVE7_LYGHE